MNKRILLGALAGVIAVVALPSAANAAATCSYSSSTRTMTVTYGAGDSTLAIRNGQFLQISDNGVTFRNCGAPTFGNTDKVVVKAPLNSAGFQNTIIDETAGDFSDSNSKLRFTVLTGTGGDHLTIKETGTDDKMSLKTGGLAVGPAIDLDMDGDTDIGMTDAGVVEVFGNGGRDTLDARGAPYTVFLHGGTNDDILIGGLRGGNWLEGGANNDLLSSNLNNLADVVDGTTGFDLVAADAKDLLQNTDGIWR
jgi:hypothetical protein